MLPYTKRFLLTLLGLFCGNAASGQQVFTDPVPVPREDGTNVRYYLEWRNDTHPSGDLFLLLQGSDCNSVSRIPNIHRMKSLCPAADVLTIEKYGITDALPYSLEIRDSFPEGFLDFDQPLLRMSDAASVIQALKEKYGYKRVIVFGGSEGASVAYLLASEYPFIDATIGLGGGGRFFIDDVTHSIRIENITDEEKDKIVEGFREFAEYLLSEESLAGRSMGDHGYIYWKTVLSLDQQDIISRIESPVLILQGGEDTSVSPEDTTKMVEELQRTGKPNIDYIFYPRYDHSLNFNREEEAWEKVTGDIRQWLHRTLGD